MLSATTVTGAVSGLAAATLEGLDGTGVRVAWTLLVPPEEALPAWVSAGPGRQAPLIDASALVVCGSGHGILAKALGRGRPVVTVPGGGEQRENADRVRRAGLGVRISGSRLTAARLRAAVGRVLDDPAYRRRAEACQPPGDARTAGDRAVDVLERVADAPLGRGADVSPSAHVSDTTAATVTADRTP
jgi:UDP:flavonoid glycosyltransferase YjiC (YdhE family)